VEPDGNISCTVQRNSGPGGGAGPLTFPGMTDSRLSPEACRTNIITGALVRETGPPLTSGFQASQPVTASGGTVLWRLVSNRSTSTSAVPFPITTSSRRGVAVSRRRRTTTSIVATFAGVRRCRGHDHVTAGASSNQATPTRSPLLRPTCPRACSLVGVKWESDAARYQFVAPQDQNAPGNVVIDYRPDQRSLDAGRGSSVETGVHALRLRGLFLIIAALSLCCAGTASAQTTAFTDTWLQPYYGSTKVSGLNGREPAQGSGYPVLIYVHGLGGIHDGPEANQVLEHAARRGFVAGAIQFDSGRLYNPYGVENLTRYAYRPQPASAVTTLCSRPKADCSKGIVASGFSMGGASTLRAKNHNPSVVAGLAFGTSGGMFALTYPQRRLPDDDLRIVVGQDDADYDSDHNDAVGWQDLDRLTGQSCYLAERHCLRPDGSGYYVVTHGEVADGDADHCWFHGAKRPGRGRCYNDPPFDPNWLDPADAEWSLGVSLNWLKRQTG
jgi:dienelactone hydrolase